MDKIILTDDEYILLKEIVDKSNGTIKEKLKNVCNKYFSKPANIKNDDVHSDGIDINERFVVLIDGEKCEHIIKTSLDESDSEEILNTSALAVAILGKHPGETFVYESNGTKHYCRIVSVDNNDF
ncbi:MAG: hypothetical protein J6X00_02595 [Clostridia bacterium]|nr:hypothetical protein [Clostridia bacterium]